MRGAPFEAALLLAAGLAAASAALCRPGHWWSPQRDACLNCTRCDTEHARLVVLRPCEVHRDTLCAPLGDLGIDWSWLADPHNARRHAKRRKQHEQRQRESIPDKRRIIWRFSTVSDEETKELLQNVDTLHTEPPASEMTLDAAREASSSLQSYEDYDSDVEVQVNSEPFLSDDEFPWDWQTVVLALAVFACVLFFLVVAAYSVHHAKQWRLLKENLEADVEGLSAKLSLMVAAAEAQDLQTPPSSPDAHYTNVRCAYLEQLLAGKGKDRALGPGNVYTQENNTY